MVGVFRSAKFRPGDIMLMNSGSKQCEAITAATRGTFCHAAICGTADTFVEAVSDGVNCLTLANYKVSDLNKIRFLRLRPELFDERKLKEAAEYANNRVGQRYSVRDAAFSVTSSGKVFDERSTFCSKLVAEAYASVGITLCPGKKPSKITPADIEKSDVLMDVTKELIDTDITPGFADVLFDITEAPEALPSRAGATDNIMMTSLFERHFRAYEQLAIEVSDPSGELFKPATTIHGIVENVLKAWAFCEEVPGRLRSFDGVVAADLEKVEAERRNNPAYREEFLELQRELRRVSLGSGSFARENYERFSAAAKSRRTQIASREEALLTWEENSNAFPEVKSFGALCRMQRDIVEQMKQSLNVLDSLEEQYSRML